MALDFLDIIAPSRLFFDETQDIKRCIIGKVNRNNLPRRAYSPDIEIEGDSEWVYLTLEGAQRLLNVYAPVMGYSWENKIEDQFSKLAPFISSLSEDDKKLLSEMFESFCNRLTLGNTMRCHGFYVSILDCHYRTTLRNRDDEGDEEEELSKFDLSNHLGAIVNGHSVYDLCMRLIGDGAWWPPRDRHLDLYDYICSHRSLFPFPKGTVDSVDIF